MRASSNLASGGLFYAGCEFADGALRRAGRCRFSLDPPVPHRPRHLISVLLFPEIFLAEFTDAAY